jgi:hypothetical protein
LVCRENNLTSKFLKQLKGGYAYLRIKLINVTWYEKSNPHDSETFLECAKYFNSIRLEGKGFVFQQACKANAAPKEVACATEAA